MKVYWAIVDHKHGRDVFLAATKRELNRHLHEYVTRWWEDAGLEGHAPKGHLTAIDQYFMFMENNGNECLEVGEQRVDALQERKRVHRTA